MYAHANYLPYTQTTAACALLCLHSTECPAMSVCVRVC